MEIKFEDIVKSLFKEVAHELIILKQSGDYLDKIAVGDKVENSDKILKHLVYTKTRFAKIHNVNVTAIDYAVRAENLDWTLIDGTIFIVMNEKGRGYVPNANKRRGSLGANIERT